MERERLFDWEVLYAVSSSSISLSVLKHSTSKRVETSRISVSSTWRSSLSMSSGSARKKMPPLGKGFSPLHWMLASKQHEPIAHPDDPSPRIITRTELRIHNTRQDCWMALRGKVYDVTRYLPYHPGSVEELMRAAADDATQLFDEIHPWVNDAAILESCFVGVLAPPSPPAAAAAAASTTPMDLDDFRSYCLVEREIVASGAVRLVLSLGAGFESRRLGLLVGEHLQVRVPSAAGGAQCGGRIRAYTPVGPLKAAGKLELIVVAAGDASRQLCALQPGDHVEARGPRGVPIYGAYGASRLKLPLCARVVGGSGILEVDAIGMVTAGSGITAVLALVRSLAELARGGAASVPKLTLVHCERCAEEVPVLEELLQLARSSGNDCCCSLALRLFFSGPPQAGGGGGAREAACDAAAAERPASVAVSRGVRLCSETLRASISPASGSSCVLVCGPPSFNTSVVSWCVADGGLPEHCVHVF